MQSTSSAGSTASPVPRDPPRTVLGRVLSVLRGDKYVADAYPPRWHSATPISTDAVAAAGHHTTAAGTARAPAVEER